jgi:hypothetical protein
MNTQYQHPQTSEVWVWALCRTTREKLIELTLQLPTHFRTQQMSEIMTASEIAHMIGVEEGIIRRTLERRDVDLEPYLREPSGGAEDAPPLLSLEGLPKLITKIAFNIPTSDIIENLACQVMHLTVLQQDNIELVRLNKELSQQNERLQGRVKELQQQLEASKIQVAALEAAQPRGWFRNIFKRD